MAVTLALSVINTQDRQAGENVIIFTEAGGTIGRSTANHCVLTDTQRFISSKHAQIDYFQGSFFLTDTSTNGCWLKGDSEAIGKGQRVELKEADIIVIGPYECLVKPPSHGADTPDELASNPFIDVKGDSIESILSQGHSALAAGSLLESSDVATVLVSEEQNGAPLSDGADLSADSHFCPASANREQIPTDWDFEESDFKANDFKDSDFKQSDSKAGQLEPVHENSKHKHLAEEGLEQAITKRQHKKKLVDEDRPAAENIRSTIDNRNEQGIDTVSSLCRLLAVTPNDEIMQHPEQLIQDVADVVNEAMSGIMGLINGRTIFKQESRLSMTTIQPRSNNPLKFSVDKQDALEHLLIRKKSAYLEAGNAVKEAITDIQIHQMAFLVGLQAALLEVLDSLSPEVIEKNTMSSGNKLLNFIPAYQSWQRYKKIHQHLKIQVNENINEFLGQDFAEAYEKQVMKLKQENQELTK